MNSDFRDLLSAFDAHGVENLIVGANALAVHLRNKRASGRLQDLADAEYLERQGEGGG